LNFEQETPKNRVFWFFPTLLYVTEFCAHWFQTTFVRMYTQMGPIRNYIIQIFEFSKLCVNITHAFEPSKWTDPANPAITYSDSDWCRSSVTQLTIKRTTAIDINLVFPFFKSLVSSRSWGNYQYYLCSRSILMLNNEHRICIGLPLNITSFDTSNVIIFKYSSLKGKIIKYIQWKTLESRHSSDYVVSDP
jgi:hypothetical protein